MRRLALTGALVLALAPALRAAPAPRVAPPDLRVRALPSPLPSTLHMRAAAAPRPPSPPPRPADPGRRPGSAAAELRAVDLVDAPEPALDQRVLFRFDLGFGIDGGEPSHRNRLTGLPLDESQTYARLRAYGLGDLWAGTRGLALPGLRTYFASEFRLDPGIDQETTAVPSVFDDTRVRRFQIRAGWAEADGLFTSRPLAPLYLRAGRQFKYGAAPVQFDGLTIGYDTRPVSLSVWTGERVSQWGYAPEAFQPDGTRSLGGVDARVDLFELRQIPLVATYSLLQFGGVATSELGAAIRWRRDMRVQASVRVRDGRAARQTVALQARLSEVTTVDVDLENRSDGDWTYDLLLSEPSYDARDLRRYLLLGPPLPRAFLDIRAGTVLLANVDVLLHGGGGFEHGGPDRPASSFAASYLEVGGAVEVRLRRSLRVGSSLTYRRYQREAPVDPDLQPGLADPLPLDTGAMGERAHGEGAVTVHYTTGERRFNAWAEGYGRWLRPQSPYIDPAGAQLDLRTGTRFGVEGWAGKRLRVKGEYDVSLAALQFAPELRGVKSLRVVAEGSF